MQLAQKSFVLFSFYTILVLVLFVLCGCGNPSPETQLNAVLQRPTGTIIDDKYSEPIIRFHKSIRHCDYEAALSDFSKTSNYENFKGIVEHYSSANLYMGIHIIGEDVIFYKVHQYRDQVNITASILTTYGWQTFSFILKNDGLDNQNEKWKVFYMQYPEMIEEDSFNKIMSKY